MNECYHDAERILKDNIEVLHSLAKALMERETLNAEEVRLIFDEAGLRKPEPHWGTLEKKWADEDVAAGKLPDSDAGRASSEGTTGESGGDVAGADLGDEPPDDETPGDKVPSGGAGGGPGEDKQPEKPRRARRVAIHAEKAEEDDDAGRKPAALGKSRAKQTRPRTAGAEPMDKDSETVIEAVADPAEKKEVLEKPDALADHNT
jgi:hypothetical protein